MIAKVAQIMIARPRKLVATTDDSIVTWALGTRHLPDQLQGVTVVLLREDRTVGFDRDDGELVAAILRGTVMVIERMNQPRWKRLSRPDVASVLELGWSDLLACTEPSAELISELEIVSQNELAERKNRILVRHEKPPHALRYSRFDDWLLPDGAIASTAVMWMLKTCQLVGVWGYSTWGRYCCLLGPDVSQLIERIEAAARDVALEFERVSSSAQLPCW